MNTFFIDPNHVLASGVVDEIRSIPGDTWISPRGEGIDRVSGYEEILYSVSTLGDGDHPSRYEWSYVTAKDWLAEYDASR